MADIKVNVFYVSRFFKALQQSAYEPTRKETGLTQMDLQIVFNMNQHIKAATVGDIQKQTGFNKGQISVCVANLFKAGYITKIKKDDTRFEAYELSEKGREIAEKLERDTAEGRKKLLKGFTREDMKIFHGYIKRIIKNAEESGADLKKNKDK